MLCGNVAKQVLCKLRFAAASRWSVSLRNTIQDYSLLPTALHSRKVDAIFKIEPLFMFTKLTESLIRSTKIHLHQKFSLEADRIQELDTLVWTY